MFETQYSEPLPIWLASVDGTQVGAIVLSRSSPFDLVSPFVQYVSPAGLIAFCRSVPAFILRFRFRSVSQGNYATHANAAVNTEVVLLSIAVTETECGVLPTAGTCPKGRVRSAVHNPQACNL